MKYEDRTVYSRPDSKKFHESEACAGENGVFSCTFAEAIDAKKVPCDVCVGDDLFNYVVTELLEW